MSNEIDKIKKCTTHEEIKNLEWRKYVKSYKIRTINQDKKPDFYMYLSKDRKHMAMFYAEKNNKVRFNKLWTEKI